MFLFFKKLIFLIVNYLCLLPNFVLYNRKTSNYQQEINKKKLKDNGFFTLSDDFLKKEKDLIFLTINRLNIHKIITDKEMINNNKGAGNYVVDLLNSNYLSLNEKNEIKNLIFQNKKLIEEISNTLGFKCLPISINLMINHFNKESVEFEGPKQWHRDNSAAAGQVKIFFLLNQIQSQSGGHFYYLPLTAIGSHKKFVIKNDYDSQKKLWNRFRYKDHELKTYLDLNKHTQIYPSNDNDSADILVINTNDCYHKGGYIKKEGYYRLLLHIVFDPALAFTDQRGNYFLKRIFTYVKNTFREKIFLD